MVSEQGCFAQEKSHAPKAQFMTKSIHETTFQFMSQSDNSLYVRLGRYPVWLAVIGFPHPPSDRRSGLNPFSNENERNP